MTGFACLPDTATALAPRLSSYYLNNFEDGHKQDALDLVTGGYTVVPGERRRGGRSGAAPGRKRHRAPRRGVCLLSVPCASSAWEC